MNKLFAVALMGGLLAPTLALADTKIAVVDLQRALEETDDGKKAKAKLKSDFDKKQKELNDKQELLKKKKDDLDKTGAMLKPEAVDAKRKELEQGVVELQNTYARLQQELAQKEQEATSGIFRKLQVVVGQIADKEHFDMVVEHSAVVWSKPAFDITNEVIRSYNSAGGGGGKSK